MNQNFRAKKEEFHFFTTELFLTFILSNKGRAGVTLRESRLQPARRFLVLALSHVPLLVILAFLVGTLFTFRVNSRSFLSRLPDEALNR